MFAVAAAGETQALIMGLKDDIAALRALIERRSCDLQNSVARVHNTANHVQNLLLVPEGTRPGEACCHVCQCAGVGW
jgi:hypothetical protein